MDSVVHFELPVKNMARAKKFYKEIFGWNLVDVPFADMRNTYVLVHTGKTDKQGMIRQKGVINGALDGSSKVTAIVIAVKNLDAQLKKAKAKGGRTVALKQEIPNVGLYAKIKDPEGNVIGLLQPVMKDNQRGK